MKCEAYGRRWLNGCKDHIQGATKRLKEVVNSLGKTAVHFPERAWERNLSSRLEFPDSLAQLTSEVMRVQSWKSLHAVFPSAGIMAGLDTWCSLHGTQIWLMTNHPVLSWATSGSMPLRLPALLWRAFQEWKPWRSGCPSLSFYSMPSPS